MRDVLIGVLQDAFDEAMDADLYDDAGMVAAEKLIREKFGQRHAYRQAEQSVGFVCDSVSIPASLTWKSQFDVTMGIGDVVQWALFLSKRIMLLKLRSDEIPA